MLYNEECQASYFFMVSEPIIWILPSVFFLLLPFCMSTSQSSSSDTIAVPPSISSSSAVTAGAIIGSSLFGKFSSLYFLYLIFSSIFQRHWIIPTTLFGKNFSFLSWKGIRLMNMLMILFLSLLMMILDMHSGCKLTTLFFLRSSPQILVIFCDM